MITFLAILLVAACFILPFLLRKGVRAGAKALNQKVLYRNEFQEEQQLIKETLTFTSKASPQAILRKITEVVSPQQEIPTLSRVVYELSRSPSLVTYAYGNKVYPKLFVAAVGFSNNGEVTKGTFEFLRWTTREGMLLNAEFMKNFRKQISKAFTETDPSVMISGAPSKVMNGAVAEGTAPENAAADTTNLLTKSIYYAVQTPADNAWLCTCGAKNEHDEAFCGRCGAKHAAAQPVAVRQPRNTSWVCACGGTNEADDAFCGRCGAKAG